MIMRVSYLKCQPGLRLGSNWSANLCPAGEVRGCVTKDKRPPFHLLLRVLSTRERLSTGRVGHVRYRSSADLFNCDPLRGQRCVKQHHKAHAQCQTQRIQWYVLK